ncbi:pyridoxamine 5'-phosphate oxidase family protein [Aureimonas frigidaquae]|uniref:Pyridoxamine 5'-phosphate oxidase-like FMN-binding protein n=1 Tax=Aureimonas frigidaquae TaxID=424757 RepID=A0A0P0Z3R8_9HYPH|nr:pyridoxamine 5'-phosphate oxidase family protein [Aureimonas frigidaquae]BAT28659.1 pyridoxamine 5'-phosphate oxidase-like FMN-binding protein [Aureimonas frigidaquae]
MATMTLSDLSKKMADIDFCMLVTQGREAALTSRPMSNNGDVEYDGDSWFFAYEDSAKIPQIEANPDVTLTFAGAGGLLGGPGIFLSAEGTAEIIRDKAAFEEHWYSDLERWFPDGTDTPGMVMIKVHAGRIRYWDGEEEGSVTV